MNYHHLTIEERACIYQFQQAGMSRRSIAKALGRNPSTISRELNRNHCQKTNMYQPVQAQKRYDTLRSQCHRLLTVPAESKRLIEEGIAKHWSPEQIVNRLRLEGKGGSVPAFSTIYRWIHKGLIIRGDMGRLRRKGKFKRPQETRGRFNIGKPIRQRPKSVYKREDGGHWEADTVESGRNGHRRKSHHVLVTLAERKSRTYLVKKLPNKSAEQVTNAIIKQLANYEVKTITCDRGKEFAGYKAIEKALKCDMYFADPYCAWQKGTNENSNGLLREFYPKGMDLAKVCDQELEQIVQSINNRPRKCLGYRTPNEAIHELPLGCCT